MWAWFENPLLDGVVAITMVTNMAIVGLAGTTIPILLDRNNIDPEIGSILYYNHY